MDGFGEAIDRAVKILGCLVFAAGLVVGAIIAAVACAYLWHH